MIAVSTIFTFKDAKNKRSSTKIRWENGLSYATYREIALAAAPIIQGLSTAELVDISVSVGLDLSAASGLKTVATQFADWFTKAFVGATTGVIRSFTKFIIPTFDDGNTSDTGEVLDTADADVQALYTLIEDGLDDGGIFIRPVDIRSNPLQAVTYGRETFRKS